jgi:hypothetical protein
MFGRDKSRRDFGATTSWRGQAFTLAALIAVFLQAFVVQTHIHTPASMLGIGYEQSSTLSDVVVGHVTSGDQKIVCAVCQALSSAGSAPLVSNASLVLTGRTNAAAEIALALAPRSLSHSWQSRAPPSFL